MKMEGAAYNPVTKVKPKSAARLTPGLRRRAEAAKKDPMNPNMETMGCCRPKATKGGISTESRPCRSKWGVPEYSATSPPAMTKRIPPRKSA
jgi:hypothetical protein